jgi:ABC-type multidrug transport system fused ATPase/permease subunit
VTARGPLSAPATGNPDAPAHLDRNTARRVTTTASTILANVVTFVSSIVAMIILSWQLTIVAVITVPRSSG